ncbi:cob(I)yrinic acid a,c-diamide adenosyltransferase [Sporolactobacillus spathodeae]|uniref:Corrinoid adenosyltransferase n=1 Tax=Sporolactobacillus spathodeae TaxID=1465502 RepID=A0ABS2QAK5_9BACL|nr:cob(I)alamin adenosyltransferase [Sporolactobacillus spathodeae]
MKLYTKRGDQGITQLIGGSKVSKDDKQVIAYGTMDELNAWLGYTMVCCSSREVLFIKELQEIQQCLFDAGHDLATPTKHPAYIFNEKQVGWLEQRIDFYSAHSPEITQFILPGGSRVAAVLHVARTITRRLERQIVALQKEAPINGSVLKYVNRLSDYFFAAARYANVINNVDDIFYDSGRKEFERREDD